MPEKANRSTLKDALQEHQELRENVSQLESFLDLPRPEIGQKGYHTWSSDLAVRLVALHDKLFRHFRTEEEGGLMDELSRMHPRAATKIDKLESEHSEILEGLRNVMSAALRYSEGKMPADPRLRQRVKKVLAKASKHEQIETEMIQELVYSDLGVAG